MKAYKFDEGRYITRGIREDLPAVLVMYLWQLIDERKNNKEVPMDYLQIIELRPEIKDNEKNLIITLRQEEPPYEEVHNIIHFTKVTGKVYVIDDIKIRVVPGTFVRGAKRLNLPMINLH